MDAFEQDREDMAAGEGLYERESTEQEVIEADDYPLLPETMEREFVADGFTPLAHRQRLLRAISKAVEDYDREGGLLSQHLRNRGVLPSGKEAL